MATASSYRPAGTEEDLLRVMTEMEASVPVALIATFRLQKCMSNAAASTVRDLMRKEAFDCVPVEHDGKVVGVIAKQDVLEHAGENAGDIMSPLDESMLMASNDPLLSFVEAIGKPPTYRLVLANGRIQGIVTLSDLQRLAVRSLLFSRVTHVELLLAKWLRRFCSGEHGRWLDRLSPKRRQKIDEKMNVLASRDFAIDPITASDFCDKREAAVKLGAFSDGTAARRKLEAIEDLRNKLAHAADYAATKEQALRTVETVRSTREVIDELHRVLTT